ncbi:MAG: pyridoxal phosphate-dependent class II aminotransferase [Ruminococcus sp.]|nr:pyridoxal phosphate-dependent class II aminotransferase [Ruminococcus sp.]
MTQQHGGNISQHQDILDFSASINPLGITESVKNAILENISDVGSYPDPYCTELREKLAEHEGVSAENIVCGNGADDLIFRIVHAIKPRKALVCAPTFSEYGRALAEVGCEICEHFLNEKDGFKVTESFLDSLDNTLDICFICTPNNPTGQLIPRDILEAIVRKCSENSTILVCDECFLGFVEGAEKYSLVNFTNENCMILKAFTKLYAMAGLRLGYAVCGSSQIAEAVQNSGQFWSVSALAQKAGIAALDESGYVRRTRTHIAGERRFLAAELRSLGVKVYDSAANFLLFKSDAGLAEKMLAEGVLIRDCSNFSGLTDGFYRIAIRTHEENTQLIAALGRCING